MTTLTTRYFLDSNPPILLGAENSSNITEKLIPNSGGHDITITKFFTGRQYHRWLVKNVVNTSNYQTDIYLEPRCNSSKEEFLSKTYLRKPGILTRLRIGSLVEVDFGYIPKIKKINGDIRSNKRYPDGILNGELHKRRLGIVVKAANKQVQVVPVTSQPPKSSGNAAIREISRNSLANLIDYNDPAKQSFALCHMIKAVSLNRILPPKEIKQNAYTAYRDISYTLRLNNDDLKQVRQGLAHSVGFHDYFELKDKVGEYYSQIEGLKIDLLNAQIELEGNRQALEQRNALFELLVDWRRGISSDSLHEATEYVESELQSYLDILGS